MLEIDGAMGEGGGQVLRSSLALSLLTQKPFRLSNIRANRSKPGLQPQHLASVRAAATIGQAGIHGDAIGSCALVFEPSPLVPGKYRFAIGTAGATALVLQTVYLPLVWRTKQPSEITLEGGTHVSNAPCFHFLDTTWRAYLERMGIQARLRLERPGFYPRGGGLVQAFLQPSEQLHAFRLTQRGELNFATGFSAVAGLPDHIARRQARRVTTRLRDRGIAADIQCEEWEGGPGTVLAVVFGQAPVPTMFFALGARGKPAEAVADELLAEAFSWLDAEGPIDPHSADQLILPLAFAEGPSEFCVSIVTRHLTTNIEVVRRFLERDIACGGAEGSAGTVRII
jgi:RNA 3'-terminal phosphate cyclase (ATP)